MLLGSVAGLVLTYASVRHPPDFGTVRSGPWVTRPGIGTPLADPYSKALMSRRGEIPFSAAEGLVLVATRDSSGRTLRTECNYNVHGVVPPAAWWTLAIHSPDGAPLNSGLRSAYTSSEALMSEQGDVSIMLSTQPQAGNWLPLSGDSRFELYLRLYETQAAAAPGVFDRGRALTIDRESCR